MLSDFVDVSIIAKHTAAPSTINDEESTTSMPGFVITKTPSKPRITAAILCLVIFSPKNSAAIISVQIGTVNSSAKTSASGSRPMPKNQAYWPIK